MKHLKPEEFVLYTGKWGLSLTHQQNINQHFEFHNNSPRKASLITVTGRVPRRLV